ncbi:MAG: carbon-monoxide dehydrogenase small subunit [Rhodobacteraceae bacterium HLUCCA12]|nr:MAG: carbon-monoxide dehydrogenase small subunit [Rhodobacteraceae bacterium HLUCCA12]
MSDTLSITLTVNGERISTQVPPRLPLIDLLRETLGLTGTHLGCAQGVCGACTVRVDGETARSCLMLAAQADGCQIDTVEGLTDSGALAALQDAFHRHNAVQCGYCTPGILLAAAELLDQAENPPTRDEIRDHISGNYCRCTGYQSVVDAIAEVAGSRAARPKPETAP